MCGIIGYLGERLAMPLLLEGLKAQEYRGYDSAGIAVKEDNTIRLTRAKGKIVNLEQKINGAFGESTLGIGHTRWATHGNPTDQNSHPHMDCKKELAVVHNGVIENYLALRENLTKEGHIFTSETDTEVLPHLIEKHYTPGTDLLDAVYAATKELEGYYAFAVLSAKDDDRLICARMDNPIIIGVADNEYFLASDMAALVEYTHEMLILKNGDIADIRKDGIKVYNKGQLVERATTTINWDKSAAQKDGYDHFMIKEIHEQPKALTQTLAGRIAENNQEIIFSELSEADNERLKNIDNVCIVACGTAYHAGLVGRDAIEQLLHLPTQIEVASEFQNRNIIVNKNTLAIVVSQSGETYDTILAMRKCQQQGAFALSVCNVLDSTIARESDAVLYTYAGPEVAVASTKAYTTQLAVLYMLTFYIGKLQGKIKDSELQRLISELVRLPQLAEQTINNLEDKVKTIAQSFKDLQHAFFIGRGMDAAVAMEGALKLKEISYIHAEAYAAGELKHGTIALIVPDVPVLALATQSDLIAKMVSNIKEIQARHALVIAITYEGSEDIAGVCKETLFIPQVDALFAPALANLPQQLLAYYAACAKGTDVDQPRNLAKSVTVG